MQLPKISVGPILWLASWCLLAAGHLPVQEELWQPCSQQSGSTNCPHPTKSVTLVPSFTKTPRPTPHPTTHPQKHTTTHHHHHHRTTTTLPTNQTVTSHHPTDPTQRHTTTREKHTTTQHHHATTTAPANRTTHATTAPSNQTVTSHHPTTHHHTIAPQPTERPVVLVGNYIVRKGSTVCLRAEMGLQLQVRYAGKAKQELWGAFPVQPNRTHISGTCTNKTAMLELRFPEGSILFVFKKDETKNTAYLGQVQANLTYQFPQATERFFSANNASLREFAAPLGKSYQCRNRSVALSGSFRLNALQQRVQAFQLRGEKFGEAEVCPEQSKSIVLPIVIGVVLCLLILIVLVAFAVGRWRAHTGYQSL
ncbi:macrosialin [Candoia aspera]|uniref:macrosialin n=1 Tax=Candoia aspera TaxID=51853 RepID=UPI002FD7A829